MVLEVNNLEKSFRLEWPKKPKKVLHGVSFSLSPHKTAGFIGANGSGKTTTIKCILGFIQPDLGEIKIFGKSYDEPQLRQFLGFLPERPYYYTFLTGLEFLRFFWDLNSLKGNFLAEAEKTLKAVDLWHARDGKLKSYSKGMLQRVGIAQALIKNPQFLIFDEPMSGLDPDGRLLIKEILLEQKARGSSILFSSHLLHDMEQICDEILVIDQGRLLYQGSIEDFKNKQNNQDIEKAFEALRLKSRKERLV
jgi:ABC-2 type transport system ATP-binding protein